ncbi:phage major capsid protein [Actinophytocola sp. NPDC049390]|uniref:phage major capsid protein n=1 Tax=Actinophytocola sp. NPDC049390 TaxID=3363894 RepID=UPI0037B222F0
MTIEEILAALQAIIDEADAAGGDLTEEQVERYEELEGKLERARQKDEVLKRHKAYTSVQATSLHTGAAKKDDTLERAFDAYLRTGQANQDIAELRAQSVGTDSAGGYTVPEGFRQKLTERLKAFGGLANEAETITTSKGERLPWPTLDDTANTGVIAAENTAPASGGADLVFGEKELNAYKYVAPGASQLPLRVSYELLQDSAFDVEGLVRRKLGERIARVQAVDWVNGAGTTEPFGITTSSGASSTFTGASLTYAELVTAKHTVDPDYRTGAKWLFNDATMALLEGLVDGNGRPLLQQSTDGIEGAPQFMLLGHPIVIDQAFPTYTDGVAQTWGAFGDLREGYVIRRVQDVTLIVNPYSRANEGQVEYTMWARADGVVQNPWSFSLLKNAV